MWGFPARLALRAGQAGICVQTRLRTRERHRAAPHGVRLAQTAMAGIFAAGLLLVPPAAAQVAGPDPPPDPPAASGTAPPITTLPPTSPTAPGVVPPAVSALPPVAAAPPDLQPVSAERIATALRIDALAEVLAAEIAATGDPTGMTAGPDKGWRGIVARIAPPDRVSRALRDGIAAGVLGLDDPRERAGVAQALASWESPLGQRTLDLEQSARRVLTDPDAETAARADFDAAAARGEPRVDQVRRLVAAADLVEPAVAAALNIALASLQGIRDSGAFEASDPDLAGDVWLQEPEIRASQAGWIEALLFMATRPLTDAEVERLIAAAGTPGAHRLNQIVDAAATTAFVAIARDLGTAAALRQAGQPL